MTFATEQSGLLYRLSGCSPPCRKP